MNYYENFLEKYEIMQQDFMGNSCKEEVELLLESYIDKLFCFYLGEYKVIGSLSWQEKETKILSIFASKYIPLHSSVKLKSKLLESHQGILLFSLAKEAELLSMLDSDNYIEVRGLGRLLYASYYDVTNTVTDNVVDIHNDCSSIQARLDTMILTQSLIQYKDDYQRFYYDQVQNIYSENDKQKVKDKR